MSMTGQIYVHVPNTPNIKLCTARHALSPSINAMAISRAATAMSAIAAFWRREDCLSGVCSTGSFAAAGFEAGAFLGVVVVVFFFLAAVDFAAVFFAAIKALLRNLNEQIGRAHV